MKGHTEEYNGSSWTELADLNTARSGAGGSGANNTAALVYGGYPSTANTEQWNGSAWTEMNNLNTARGELAGGGIRGGKQDSLFENGNQYLDKYFPKLDFIIEARLIENYD